LRPGDLTQKLLADLGIEAVPAADLKNSKGTTETIDHLLDRAKLDPKHYNCNDYVKMFVLSKESEKVASDYINSRTGPAMTDSPEGFLQEHGYKSIAKPPLKDGDIVVVHGPGVQHTAVICEDPQTHQLYTMQKPNPKEMPVRLSLDQFVRAEKVSVSNI